MLSSVAGTDGNTAVPKRNLRGSRRCTLALARIKRNNYEENARIRWILTIRWNNEGLLTSVEKNFYFMVILKTLKQRK